MEMAEAPNIEVTNESSTISQEGESLLTAMGSELVKNDKGSIDNAGEHSKQSHRQTDDTDSRNEIKTAYDELCAEHGDKLSFYCEGHECFICGQCKYLSHAACEDGKYIPHIKEDIFECAEVEMVTHAIIGLQEDVNATKVLIHTALDKGDLYEKDVLCELATLCTQMNECFDEVERRICEKAKAIQDADREINGETLDQSDRVLKDLIHRETMLKGLIQSRSIEEFYRLMKNTKTMIKELTEEISDLKSRISTTPYTVGSVNFSENLQNVLKTSIHLDRDLEQDNVDAISKREGENESLVKKYPDEETNRLVISKLRTNEPPDRGSGCTTELLVLDNSMLVVVNYNHKRVTCFEYTNGHWDEQGKVRLDSRPWSAAKLDINSHRIAVTLPDDNAIAVINVADFTLESIYDVGIECRGIAFNINDQTIIVSSPVSNQFKAFDLNGKLKTTFRCNMKFMNPSFLALSPNGKQMFVSDLHNGTVSRVDLASKSVEDTYNREGCRPFGLELVESDLYVCDQGSHQVLRLDAYGSMENAHHYSKEQLTCQHALAVSPKRKTLFVSKYNAINVFKFPL